jgi:hypothetical protein
MQAENFLLNNSSEGEVIEEISEVFPHISVSILPKALIIKTIDLSDLAGFMITT